MVRNFVQSIALGGGLLLAGNTLASDGDLDLTFGSAGGYTRAGIVDDAFDVAMAVQRDGKFLTCSTRSSVGSTSYDFFVARFQANGTLDPTFGTNGTLDPTFGTNGTTTIDFDRTQDSCTGIAVQSDGMIVVAGAQYFPAPFGPGRANMAIARLAANGVLDSTFGNGSGKTIVSFDAGSSSAAAVTLQPDAKIVVAGRAKAGEPASAWDFAVVRLLSDGSLDPAFGTNGKATAGFNDLSSYDVASSVALDLQGRILLAGSQNSSSGIARFLGDGQLDMSFGTNGLVDLGAVWALKIIAQHDGKIAIAGSLSSGSGSNVVTSLAAMRRLDNGSPDPSFGTLGTATVSFNLSATVSSELARDMVEQSDGKLVLVGSTRYGDGNYSKAVATRLDTSGQLDASFGIAGKAVFAFGLSTFDSKWLTSAGLSDGRVIAAGSAIVSDTSENALDVVVVRLQSDLIFTHGFEYFSWSKVQPNA